MLAPEPTDLLSIAIQDARAALEVDEDAAWLVPGARSLAALALGADPNGQLRVALGVRGEPDGRSWPPPEELRSAEAEDASRPWRQPLDDILRACWAGDPLIPSPVRRALQCRLAWHCGSESRVEALCLSVTSQRAVAEAAIAAGGDVTAICARFEASVSGGRMNEDGGSPAPEAPKPRSPLHRWTWQRVLLFILLVGLSLWVYLGDK